MTTEDDSREQGVEFGSLADDLETEEYPLSTADLLDAYGDREIELEDGTRTLRELIGPMGETTFDSAEKVKRAVTSMTGSEAVGREDYSDRGLHTDDEDEQSL